MFLIFKCQTIWWCHLTQNVCVKSKSKNPMSIPLCLILTTYQFLFCPTPFTYRSIILRSFNAIIIHSFFIRRIQKFNINAVTFWFIFVKSSLSNVMHRSTQSMAKGACKANKFSCVKRKSRKREWNNRNTKRQMLTLLR